MNKWEDLNKTSGMKVSIGKHVLMNTTGQNKYGLNPDGTGTCTRCGRKWMNIKLFVRDEKLVCEQCLIKELKQ